MVLEKTLAHIKDELERRGLKLTNIIEEQVAEAEELAEKVEKEQAKTPKKTRSKRVKEEILEKDDEVIENKEKKKNK